MDTDCFCDSTFDFDKIILNPIFIFQVLWRTDGHMLISISSCSAHEEKPHADVSTAVPNQADSRYAWVTSQ